MKNLIHRGNHGFLQPRSYSACRFCFLNPLADGSEEENVRHYASRHFEISLPLIIARSLLETCYYEINGPLHAPFAYSLSRSSQLVSTDGPKSWPPFVTPGVILGDVIDSLLISRALIMFHFSTPWHSFL